MIKYHGTPITNKNNTKIKSIIKQSHMLVSFAHPEQLDMVTQSCESFCLDNGAFSNWMAARKGKAPAVTSWEPYFDWVYDLHRHPAFDFAIIPDVIMGSEEENDQLIEDWVEFCEDTVEAQRDFGCGWAMDWRIGAPVWHMNESIERLVRLAERFPRICIGSCAEFDAARYSAGSPFRERMEEVWEAITRGFPITKVHGLRMLNWKVFTDYPFSSCDSTNLAVNNRDFDKRAGGYGEGIKLLKNNIENHTCLSNWEDSTETPAYLKGAN